MALFEAAGWGLKEYQDATLGERMVMIRFPPLYLKNISQTKSCKKVKFLKSNNLRI